MAERRMFSKTVVQSARFLKLPLASQALYFQMGVSADDDGVVESFPIMRMVGASDDDLKILIERNFVKVLNDDLVAYMVDWKKNNTIRADRYKESIYHNLIVKLVSVDNQMETNGKPHGNQMETQYSIGKESIGEYSIDKGSVGEERKEESKDSVEIPNTSSPIGADDVDMTIKYFFLRYLAYKGEAHEEVSPQKMEEIKANLDEAGATREFVDVYFGDDEHKGLCGESDCKIFHFASPTVLNLIGGRINGSVY